MERFGEYVLYEQLGPGKRAIVNRATVATGMSTARPVAIKRFPIGLFPSRSAASRHAVEVARVSQLRHPNIAAVHRVGRLGDTTYVEMEHVVGSSLDDLLHDIRTDGPPPIDVVVSIVAELAAALGLAHDHGIVHGDIQPYHLLIDSAGHLKIIGFGMAQVERPMAERCYAAPESLDGEPTDARSDVYSLGVVAYELVTGQPLFDEHMDPELRRYLGSSIRAPSTCNDACPPELDALILRALATDPGERWATARRLCPDLEALGGPAPDRVSAWIERSAPHTRPRASSEPLEMPAPPRRAARGSGRLPSPASLAQSADDDESVHDVATEILEATPAPRRSLDLPLRAPSEPYAELGIASDENWSSDERLASAVTVMREPLAAGDALPWPLCEPTPVDLDEPPARPGSEPRVERRYVELALAFAAGALVMYLALALFA
jgi:serine/threonine-protein kinase